MKVRVILSEEEVDFSKFSELKQKKLFGFTVIEFDASEHERIFDLICDTYKVQVKKESFGKMAYGDDKYAYVLEKGGLRKCCRCWSYHWIAFRNYICSKAMRKYESERESVLAEVSHTQSTQRPSITPYKNCRYYDKENKLWFAYRFRVCKKKNAPLVVFLHGNGSNGTDNRKSLGEFLHSAKIIASKECSIIIPQAPYTCRTDATEPIYLTSLISLIDSAAEKTGADKSRIYLIGGSRGGINAWQLAWMHPDYFACAIPVAGEFCDAFKSGKCSLEKMKDIPMWVFHSEDDTNVTVDSDDFCVEKLRELGSDIRYTRKTDAGHNFCNITDGEDWLGWMFEQSLDKR